MCPIKKKRFLNHLLTLTLPKQVLISCSYSYSTNSEDFPKFAAFMDPLGVIIPAPISQKPLFGIIN